MFGIEKSIADWKTQLTQRQTMTPSDVDEMEMHLRDEMDHLQKAGLTAEESFLVACRRIGDCDQVAGEFAKINGNVVWKNRFFWMIIGVLTMEVLSSVAKSATGISAVLAKWCHVPVSWYLMGMLVPVASSLVVIGLGWCVYQCAPKLAEVSDRMRTAMIVTLALSAVVVGKILQLMSLAGVRIATPEAYGQFVLGSMYANLGLSFLWPFFLATLLIWLRHTRTQRA